MILPSVKASPGEPGAHPKNRNSRADLQLKSWTALGIVLIPLLEKVALYGL